MRIALDSNVRTVPDNSAHTALDSSRHTVPDNSALTALDSSTPTAPDNRFQLKCSTHKHLCPIQNHILKSSHPHLLSNCSSGSSNSNSNSSSSSYLTRRRESTMQLTLPNEVELDWEHPLDLLQRLQPGLPAASQWCPPRPRKSLMILASIAVLPFLRWTTLWQRQGVSMHATLQVVTQ